MRRLAGVLILSLAGCSPERAPSSSAFYLVEKGPYQALYGPDGRLERLVCDEDGDRRADAVLLYGPGGKIRRAEIDTDHDGRIDRREYFDERGALARVVTE